MKRNPPGYVSSTSPNFAAKASASPGLAVLAPQESAMVAGEGDSFRPEPFGHCYRSTMGQFALRPRADGVPTRLSRPRCWRTDRPDLHRLIATLDAGFGADAVAPDVIGQNDAGHFERARPQLDQGFPSGLDFSITDLQCGQSHR